MNPYSALVGDNLLCFHCNSCIPCDWFEFLDLRDVVHLDTVCLNHNLRNEWLGFLRGSCAAGSRLPLTPSAVAWLVQRQVGIRNVRFAWTCGKDTYASFTAIKKWTTSISLANCINVDDSVLFCLTSGSHGNVLELNLTECTNLSDRGVIMALHSFPRLQSLVLHGCCGLSNAVMHEVSQRCHHMRQLSLAYLFRVTSDAVERVVQSCTDIQSLDLTMHHCITDNTIWVIARHLPHLQNLVLAYCGNITDRGVSHLAQFCRGLRSLDLSYCRHLTDTSLLVLAGRCAQLSSLQLACCRQVTDAGITVLASACTGLVSLNLSYCVHLTDSGVSGIALHCPELSIVSLFDCKHVTDAGITALALHCIHLRDVNLDYCFQITDISIAALSEHCPQLESLRLSGCARVSDAGLEAIAVHCGESLRFLGIQFNPNISNTGVVNLTRCCPQLKTLLR
jgi:F-box/leucine-rich repeat protein 2/20